MEIGGLREAGRGEIMGEKKRNMEERGLREAGRGEIMGEKRKMEKGGLREARELRKNERWK